jgi:hypothetical protein
MAGKRIQSAVGRLSLIVGNNPDELLLLRDGFRGRRPYSPRGAYNLAINVSGLKISPEAIEMISEYENTLVTTHKRFAP